MPLKKNKMKYARKLHITKIGGDKMTEYIDKEKAKEILNEDYAYAAAKLLDKVPVANVTEVKSGKWMQSTYANNFFRCSECDAVWSRKFSFCPSCGTKMDEEK